MTDTHIQDTPATRERADYNQLRQRAVQGEDISEDQLMDSLRRALAAEDVARHKATLAADRAKHKSDEAKQIAATRKAAEGKLDGLAQELVAAQRVRREALPAMKDAIAEYNTAARTERGAISRLREALRENGYPDKQPLNGSESIHTHPSRHYDAMHTTVRWGKIAGSAPGMARSEIPRFLPGVSED